MVYHLPAGSTLDPKHNSVVRLSLNEKELTFYKSLSTSILHPFINSSCRPGSVVCGEMCGGFSKFLRIYFLSFILNSKDYEEYKD